MRILTTGSAGFATAVILGACRSACQPIGADRARSPSTGGGLSVPTVNAYNPWALVASDTGVSLAEPGGGSATRAPRQRSAGPAVAVFGVVPAIAIGTALLVGAFLVVLWAAWRPDRLTLLVGLAVLALAFFVLPTRVHERYGYPFFALGVDPRRDLAGAGGSRTWS